MNKADSNEDTLSGDSSDIENEQNLSQRVGLKQKLLEYQIVKKEKIVNTILRFLFAKLILVLVVLGLLYFRPVYFVEKRSDTNMFTIESINHKMISATILLKTKGTLSINSC